MSAEFDFLTPDDKPALMGLASTDLLDNAKAALDQLGYKVHAAANHGEFLHKFAQTPYHVIVLEDVFGGGTIEENESLLAIQRLPMPQRRHCVIILVGQDFATFNPMQAFQQGVHSVVNPSEAFLLIQLIQKAVADNDIFLHTFRHAQQRLC
jgi:CheY-like chemotaxis protein